MADWSPVPGGHWIMPGPDSGGGGVSTPPPGPGPGWGGWNGSGPLRGYPGQIPDWINQRRAALGLPPMTWPTGSSPMGDTGGWVDGHFSGQAGGMPHGIQQVGGPSWPAPGGPPVPPGSPPHWVGPPVQPPTAGSRGDGGGVVSPPLPPQRTAPPPGAPPWYSHWQDWMQRSRGGGGVRGIY